MCGHYLGEQGGAVCSHCVQTLPRTEQARYRHNSTEMELAGKHPDIVAALKTMHLTRAAAFLHYEKGHPVQHLIHQLKYRDLPQIGYQLGRQAAMEMYDADFFDEIEVIVPIPLHPKRFRERGYNQSEYIARGIGEYLGVPVDTSHVVRVLDTPHQARLTNGTSDGQNAAALRKENVANAFAVIRPEQMYHKHILLVDDLITTGETMRACLRAMRVIRGATISVFALCKAR